MTNQFSRTELLLGKEAMQSLSNAHVVIFGIGGVGGYVVEGLVRCGVGSVSLIDSDEICVSNINRQLVATTKTIDMQKTIVMKDRILEINPNAKVITHQCFFSADNADEFDFSSYDYIVDAIDTVTSKLLLIEKAKDANVKIMSCMGAGNKLNPTMLEVADIYKTSVCPLARVMRRELAKRNIQELKVVFSKEPPIKPKEHSDARKQTPGSVSFVPSVAGLIIAGEVIKDLINFREC